MFDIDRGKIFGSPHNQPEPTSDSPPEQPQPEDTPPVMTIENQAVPFEDKLEGVMASLSITEPRPFDHDILAHNARLDDLENLIEDPAESLFAQPKEQAVIIMDHVHKVDGFESGIPGSSYSITEASPADIMFALAAEG